MDGEPEILTPNDVARRWKLDRAEVIAAAERGDLPGFRVAGRWRFSAEDLRRWTARSRPAPPAPSLVHLPQGLCEILPLAHVTAKLRAAASAQVVCEVAAIASGLGLVTGETWFAGALAEREAMLSTAVEGGLAFLHARRANTAHIARPFVLLARSAAGVPFGAPDGRPTRLFVVLGLKYDRLHLRWLSRLARMLRREAIVEALVAAPDAAAMHAILVGRDAALPTAARAPGGWGRG